MFTLGDLIHINNTDYPILEYNSGLSFGIGAEHFSIKVERKKVKIHGGTPMKPALIDSLPLNQSTVDLINQLEKVEGFDRLSYYLMS